MPIKDAALRMGVPPVAVEKILTVLHLPGRKRVPTAQVEAFEKWVEVQALSRPWLKAMPLGGRIEISGGEEESK